MKRLNDQRISELHRFLQESGLCSGLLPELLDHLACEAEERLWEGQPLEQVMEDLRKEVNSDTFQQLSVDRKHLLAREESLNDIVFEKRNKTYGAYRLRREYQGNVQRATLIGVGIFLLIFCLPELYARLNPAPETDDIGFEVEFTPVNIKPEATPTPPVVETPPPAVNTVRALPPVVLPDEQVIHEHQPPTVEKFEEAQPGQETVEGESASVIVVPPAEVAGTGKETLVEVSPEVEKEFLFAEQQPEFVGGQRAFAEYLRKNLRYPREAARAGIQGKVFLEFSVGPDGAIERARVIKGIGFGCDEEALRVIGQMPDWMPGRQSGRPVRVKYTLPIAFQLD